MQNLRIFINFLINGIKIMTKGYSQHKKIIQVAVAVIQYEQDGQVQYLLGTRHAHQHQGGKLEFVGGKIEQHETAKAALIREVREELGLDIGECAIVKMGRIGHDYAEKSVCLHIYQVSLSKAQYLEFQHKTVGSDGQKIGFYDLASVMSQKDDFPDANAPIFTWLGLPKVVVVSHELSFFKNKTDWLDCYKKVPSGSTLLMRTFASTQANAWMMAELDEAVENLKFVISWQDVALGRKNILAVRLTQNELMSLDLKNLCLPNLPIIASCHDDAGIIKVNELAKQHPVMAITLSPVKPTQTHPNALHLGWESFAKLAFMSNVPVIALGGLSPTDLNIARSYGAVAVAGIRGFI